MISNPLSFGVVFKKLHKAYGGFTIVELLVVVVVIGILAAVSIISYVGISQKATVASLQSDLSSAAQQLRIFQIDNGSYPITINCAIPNSATNLCLKNSSGVAYTYQTVDANHQTFELKATKSSTSYTIANNSTPTLSTPTSCPTGFIVVPGSIVYGTGDFCVMKYEAKQVGATNVPISQAAGTPWVNISQATAMANSPNVVGCPTCHLISETEWLTIAQNVLSVPSNWSSGSIGNGYIYSGHNDSAPANALAADANDSNGYSGETNVGGNQRRTLTLTNGEVIWDLSGNVHDWTAGRTLLDVVSQPGITSESGWGYKEWNASPMTVGNLAVNPFPSFATPAASGWNSTSNGMGRLYSYKNDIGLYGFRRGGAWDDGSGAGVFALLLNYDPGNSSATLGFRVASN